MYQQVLVVRMDLQMDKGKMAAQVAHASLASYLKAQQSKYKNWCDDWLEEGMKKIVVKVQTERELLELFEQVKRQFPAALITDAGHTQVAPGSKTCLGIGPAPENELHRYTGRLKLL
ncbi:MAG: peptidyl-tRNA hydrolase [Candidatus Iainarchaeum archaeon]|uniref:Peptidyl-tRNA hydrolase n=1 Tax=Candidatus Iainarchaeum sp. TaxID=3101447 RepID=A0A7T9DJV1_9ARCH|nr:MAG: peptidyl-tRNA hydrolase [Candidatus Diapherotrites archaeon]